jgi:hypothetical protein
VNTDVSVHHAASIFRVLEPIIAESFSETPVNYLPFYTASYLLQICGGDEDDDGCVGLKYAINIL